MKNLLVIDGPSAVGKTTIVNSILKIERTSFEVAKRVTTREKRNSEEDELSYDFTDLETFKKMIINNEFIEYKHYLFGMSYGLPEKSVIHCFKKNKHAIGIINLGNFNMVIRKIPNAFGVFLDTSIETIKLRLESRNIHTPEQIEERLENARMAFALKKDYDLVIRNENRPVSEVVAEILENFEKFNEKIYNDGNYTERSQI